MKICIVEKDFIDGEEIEKPVEPIEVNTLDEFYDVLKSLDGMALTMPMETVGTNEKALGIVLFPNEESINGSILN